MRNKSRGFTLIELMIVVAIIGILCAIAVPKFQELVQSSRRREQLQKRGYAAVVKQFGQNGEKMGEWRVKWFMERRPEYVKFLTTDDKLLTVSGSYVIEE